MTFKTFEQHQKIQQTKSEGKKGGEYIEAQVTDKFSFSVI